MSEFREVTFGEHLFSKIDENRYLNKLYHNILWNYSKRLFQLNEKEEKPVDIDDALTFADILSKSYGTSLADAHKTRAQEIAALLYEMNRDNEDVKYVLGSVLTNTGNFLGFNKYTPEYRGATVLERLFAHFNMEYLTVPGEEASRFFPAQKEIYDSFEQRFFSYSAPTSMGKSYMMRVFIKHQIQSGEQQNFAILLPTKALINEVTSELIDGLKGLLKEKNYRIVTSSGALALETEHNYVFVVTPERMHYILLDDEDMRIDYLFIDEAHKISSGDKRSAFYYKVIEQLEDRKSNTHVIFASPNIPNPKVYLDMITSSGDIWEDSGIIASRYAPVSQLKYIVDLYERTIRIFDSYSKQFIKFHDMSNQYTLTDVIMRIGEARHNLVYCRSKADAISFAQNYAKKQNPLNDDKLKNLAESIRKEVHKEYYLAELVERGVAYHIGYLPANIRMQLEDYYRDGLIKTMFCTSTLLEGVNLPAENLFITSFKKGYGRFSSVDFKNLVGRVGRAKYNLYGNVFVVRLLEQEGEDDLRKYETLLKEDVEPQKLSVESELNSNQKKLIVKTLLAGEVEIPKSRKDQSENNYDLMRKTMLILLGDIVACRRSRVRREFDPYLSIADAEKIRTLFSTETKKPIDDLNVSHDQINGIEDLIRGGECYPEIKDPKRGADYTETYKFLVKLAKAFKWRTYENGTLGAGEGDSYTKLSWYAVLLIKWMQGYGLNFIINDSIQDYDKKKRDVKVRYDLWESYNGSQLHKNIIIADTLEAIEEVLLFRLSNYFLRFSEEYKRQHPNEPFKNDWHEFVEYGTTNKLRIILQRSGYKRESTEYIRRNAEKYVKDPDSDDPKLYKKLLLDCPHELTKRDTEEIQYNVPELFIEEGEK